MARDINGTTLENAPFVTAIRGYVRLGGLPDNPRTDPGCVRVSFYELHMNTPGHVALPQPDTTDSGVDAQRAGVMPCVCMLAYALVFWCSTVRPFVNASSPHANRAFLLGPCFALFSGFVKVCY